MSKNSKFFMLNFIVEVQKKNGFDVIGQHFLSRQGTKQKILEMNLKIKVIVLFSVAANNEKTWDPVNWILQVLQIFVKRLDMDSEGHLL